jgi:hypothetical protein
MGLNLIMDDSYALSDWWNRWLAGRFYDNVHISSDSVLGERHELVGRAAGASQGAVAEPSGWRLVFNFSCDRSTVMQASHGSRWLG